MESLTMVIQMFKEEGMSHTWRQVRSKAKRMLIIFFDMKWIVHREFVLADQTVNSASYCDIL
jgi:hypothetical protein